MAQEQKYDQKEKLALTDKTLACLCNTIREHKLACSSTPVVLMVSGGSDSTALAYLGRELADRKIIGPIALLHVNHGIRGAASDGDQAFVEKLAALLEIPLFTCTIDVPSLAKASGENIEAIARHERYEAANQALESLCRHTSIPLSEGRIFTAHTQDDRVENFYMRSIVGTGPGGFRSMRYLNGNVARPCLDLSRQDLRDYLASREAAGLPTLVDEDPNANAHAEKDLAQSTLQEAGVEAVPHATTQDVANNAQRPRLWREDATNAHTDLFRGYVRHEIVPRAKARNTQLLSTLTRTMNLIADEDDFMDSLAQEVVTNKVKWIANRPDSGREPCVSTKGKSPSISGGTNETGFSDKPEVESDFAIPKTAEEGCIFAPDFGSEALPLQRRAALFVLQQMIGPEARVETATVTTLLAAWENGKPISGYKANVQGNLAISANKQGVRLEPMEIYRARRKRI